MAELTGLYGIEWAAVFVILFGLSITAMSFRGDIAGLRAAGFLVVPMLAGVYVLAMMATQFRSTVERFVPFLVRPVTAGIVLASAFVAVAVADLLFSRFVPLPRRLLRAAPTARMDDLGLLIFIGGAAVAAVWTMTAFTNVTVIQPGASGLPTALRIESVHSLPGPPFGIALSEPRKGYLSLGKSVVRFTLSDDDRLQLTTVATGFDYARGLTIAGRVLVVADLGPLPCPDPFPFCKGGAVPGGDVVEGGLRILEESRGRLVAFNIAPDGSLSNRRTILGDLPVADNEHGVNGLATGPDGMVYASIGGIDETPPDEAVKVRRPHSNLLGTVIRLAADGSNMEVFARGLRNVYGLTFDPRGGLWGVDNDGDTVAGWRAEEVLHIRQGENYGYPLDGSSFGPHDTRTDFSIWNIQGPGTAGVAWAGDAGLGPGLLTGSCGHIDGLRFRDVDGDWRVTSPADYARMIDLPGCVTDIKVIGRGTLLAALFRTDALYVLRAED